MKGNYFFNFEEICFFIALVSEALFIALVSEDVD